MFVFLALQAILKRIYDKRREFSSGHTALKQRRFNVDVELTLFQRCVPSELLLYGSNYCPFCVDPFYDERDGGGGTFHRVSFP